MFSLTSPRRGRVLLLFGLLTLGILFPSAHQAHAQTASQVYTQAVEALNRGDVDGARQKLQLALEIDPNFRPANALLTRMAAAQRRGGAAAGLSTRTLERTVIPVEFNETTLTSALEYIRQKVAEDSGGKLQINFAINLPPELANKRVTLKMDHVPVPEILRYIGVMAGVSFEKQPYAILVTPAADKPVVPSANPAPAGTPRT